MNFLLYILSCLFLSAIGYLAYVYLVDNHHLAGYFVGYFVGVTMCVLARLSENRF